MRGRRQRDLVPHLQRPAPAGRRWDEPRRQPDLGAGAQLHADGLVEHLGARHRRRGLAARTGTAAPGATGSSLGGGDHRRAGRRVARRGRRQRLRPRRRQRDLPALLDRAAPAGATGSCSTRARSTRRPPPPATAPSHEWVVARGGSGLLIKEWTAGARLDAWVDLGPVVRARRRRRIQPGADARTATSNLEAGTALHARRRAPARAASASASRRARRKRACRGSSSSPRARAARSASTARRRSSCGSRSTGPAGSTGRVYARVYYRRSAKGKLHRKTVSRRYTVCR